MMTNLDIARLAFEFHATRLERALGRGGAPVNLDGARVELAAVQSALDELRTELAPEVAP